jgi:hypothetical protein
VFFKRIFVNELIFLFHIVTVIAFIFAALRLGKSALSAFIAMQAVLANLFVVKQISLFRFSVTCSDVFAIGSILSLNLLQEYFGKEAAKHAARISFLLLLFFAIASQIHLSYLPTLLDTTQSAFSSIFASSPRIIMASIATFYLVQQWDVRFFSYLKGSLPIRVAISLIFSQLLDTTLFSFLGLYGLVESLFDIIALSFLIKCIIIGVNTPFVLLSKRFVKNAISI